MKRLLTSTAIVAAMAMPAFAEQHDSKNGDAMQQGQQADTQQNQQSEMQQNKQGEQVASDQQSKNRSMQIQATDLIDKRIYMAAESELKNEIGEVPDEWQMVGDIDDLIVTKEGEVRALLVDAGGFLGMDEDELRIDVQNIRFVINSNDEGDFYVVYNGDRSKFESESSYDEEQAQSQGEMRASENEQMAGAMEESPQRQQENVDWASITTEDVLGSAVYGENDEWIGDLSELDLADDGSVKGVIIDVGGFLGIGEKPVEMPMDKVELRRTGSDEIRAYVSATEDELENMDEWTPDES